LIQRNVDFEETTHRLLAWGVLGLATGGFFSLLTLLFSGGIPKQTPDREQSFGQAEILIAN
jgi:hypothetical protein